MKKYISILFILTLFLSYGCQDELEADFADPSIYAPEGDVPAGMFSEMMSRTRTFKNDYAEFWWHANTTGGMIGHTHLVMRHIRDSYGFYSSANDVPLNANTQTLENYYYGHNRDFREIPIMADMITDMPEEEKADSEIYLTLSKMVRLYRTSKAVDLYNSVPYSEALRGTEGIFFPKFDDPLEIYKDLIDELGRYSDLIIQNYNTLSANGKRIFETQDVIFEGDPEKWQQFTNAVRLRLAVRISGVQQEFAEQAIADILQNGSLPTGDLLIPASLWVSKDGDHWKRGLKERDYTCFIAPTIMYKMDRDKDHVYTPGTDDPRIPVLFLPNRDTLYMPTSFDFGVGQKVFDAVKDSNLEKYGFGNAYFYFNYYEDLDGYMKYNAYSVWNPATMVRNIEPWRAFTQAEVDFLLAEVALKGLGATPKSATEHVKDGVKHSIDYWYHINSFSIWDKINDSNRHFLMPTAPDQSIKDQFASVVGDEYDDASGLEDKMEVIIGQKYVHLNIHDYLEVYSELRRTKHPRLPLMKFSETLTLAPRMERYPYPGSVPATNGDQYAAVTEQDNFHTPIFWVPDGLRDTPYYMEDFDEDYLYIQYPGVPESFPPN